MGDETMTEVVEDGIENEKVDEGKIAYKCEPGFLVQLQAHSMVEGNMEPGLLCSGVILICQHYFVYIIASSSCISEFRSLNHMKVTYPDGTKALVPAKNIKMLDQFIVLSCFLDKDKYIDTEIVEAIEFEDKQLIEGEIVHTISLKDYQSYAEMTSGVVGKAKEQFFLHNCRAGTHTVHGSPVFNKKAFCVGFCYERLCGILAACTVQSIVNSLSNLYGTSGMDIHELLKYVLELNMDNSADMTSCSNNIASGEIEGALAFPSNGRNENLCSPSEPDLALPLRSKRQFEESSSYSNEQDKRMKKQRTSSQQASGIRCPGSDVNHMTPEQQLPISKQQLQIPEQKHLQGIPQQQQPALSHLVNNHQKLLKSYMLEEKNGKEIEDKKTELEPKVVEAYDLTVHRISSRGMLHWITMASCPVPAVHLLMIVLLSVIFIHVPAAAAVIVPNSNCYTFGNESRLVDFTHLVEKRFEYNEKGLQPSDLFVEFCKDAQRRSQGGFIKIGRFVSSHSFLSGIEHADYIQALFRDNKPVKVTEKNSAAATKPLDDLSNIEFPGAKLVSDTVAKSSTRPLAPATTFILDKVAPFILKEEPKAAESGLAGEAEATPREVM